MSKIYKLNQIPIKTERDAMEFIDMVAFKLPAIKKVLSKHLLEKQSLYSQIDNLTSKISTDGQAKVYADPNASVLTRATTAPTEVVENEGASRLAQLREAQEPKPPVDPGEIGQLDVEEIDVDAVVEQRPETQPAPEDLVPIGERVSGKSQAFKVVEKLRKKAQANNDLRKK